MVVVVLPLIRILLFVVVVADPLPMIPNPLPASPPLLVGERTHVVVEAGDENTAVFILQLRNEMPQHVKRVVDAAAVAAGV